MNGQFRRTKWIEVPYPNRSRVANTPLVCYLCNRLVGVRFVILASEFLTGVDTLRLASKKASWNSWILVLDMLESKHLTWCYWGNRLGSGNYSVFLVSDLTGDCFVLTAYSSFLLWVVYWAVITGDFFDASEVVSYTLFKKGWPDI